MYIFLHCTNRGGGLIQSVELSENTAYASGQQRGGGADPGYTAVTKETPAKSTQESEYDEPFVPPSKTESPPEYAVVQKKKKPEEPPADEGDDENILVFEDD